MRKSIALLGVLIVGSILPRQVRETGAHAAVTSSGMPTVVTTEQSGVRLTLRLWGSAFPRDALVQARVTLTNLTGHTVSTWECMTASLGAEIVAPFSSNLTYPPLLVPPGAPWSSCPMGMGPMGMQRHGIAIVPGTSIERVEYVVLRTLSLRARASLAITTKTGKPLEVVTPEIHLRETRTAIPYVRIVQGKTVSARVSPVNGGGPVLYSEYASCAPHGHTTHAVVETAPLGQWVRAAGTVIHPLPGSCTVVNEWVLFVGQAGHPIAHAYYCSNRNFCAYAPPTAQMIAIGACKTDVGRALMSGQLPRAVARYAVGISTVVPPGLTPRQAALARRFHARCAPLLGRKVHAP